jgi:hypothetical protein
LSVGSNDKRRVAEWEAGKVVQPLVRIYEVIDLLGLSDADILVRPNFERSTSAEQGSKGC